MSRIIKDKTRQSLPICYEKEVQSRRIGLCSKWEPLTV